MIQNITHSNPYYNSNTINRKNYSCTSCIMPQKGRNYCIFDKEEVEYFVKNGEKSFPFIKKVLTESNNEPQIVETLHIVNKMLDNGTKNVVKLYPYVSRFNNTNSPTIQSYLAGIYRKTQIPDGFGPLVKMLIQNSINPAKSELFDPNEEIGGAILSYISPKNKQL